MNIRSGTYQEKLDTELRRVCLTFIREVTWSDAKKLQFLERRFGHMVEEAHVATQERVRFLNRMKPVAEGGMVEMCTHTEWEKGQPVQVIKPMIAVVWSGRDCDGVQYSGYVRMVDCTHGAKEAVEQHITTEYESADGPCSWFLMRPSAAQLIQYVSRDLGMEAHEDGHPSIISSVRFDERGDY